jgi:hypothetical protein
MRHGTPVLRIALAIVTRRRAIATITNFELPRVYRRVKLSEDERYGKRRRKHHVIRLSSASARCAFWKSIARITRAYRRPVARLVVSWAARATACTTGGSRPGGTRVRNRGRPRPRRHGSGRWCRNSLIVLVNIPTFQHVIDTLNYTKNSLN